MFQGFLTSYGWFFEVLAISFLLILCCRVIGVVFSYYLPLQFKKVYNDFFSYSVGLSILIFLATLHGMFFQFNTDVCILEMVIILTLSGTIWFFKKTTYFTPLTIFLLFILVFLITVIIFGPQLLNNTFLTANDSITYLIHSQWLQGHCFTNTIKDQLFYPALQQVNHYQTGVNVGRMGGSFFFAWVQALFNFSWSYRAYPIVLIVALVAGSLSVGGIIKLFVPAAKSQVFLAVLIIGLTLNGFPVGAINGFYPQTLGITFYMAFFALFIWCFSRSRIMFSLIFPMSFLAAGVIFCYPEFLPAFLPVSFVSAFFYIFTGVESLNSRKDKIHGFLLLLFLVLIITSFQLPYMISGIIKALKSFVFHNISVGWSTSFSLFDYLLQLCGLVDSTAPTGFSNNVTNTIIIVLILLFLIPIMIYLKKLSNLRQILPFLLSIMIFAVCFIKYRYFAPPLRSGDIGQTYLQWKAVLWASPFFITLLMIAFFTFTIKRNFLYTAGCVIFLLLMSFGIHKYLLKSWDTLPTYSNYLDMRNTLDVQNIHKEPVYLSKTPEGFFGSVPFTFSYFLYDYVLVGDWIKDKNIKNSLMKKTKWMIEFDSTKDRNLGFGEYRFGPIFIKKLAD